MVDKASIWALFDVHRISRPVCTIDVAVWRISKAILKIAIRHGIHLLVCVVAMLVNAKLHLVFLRACFLLTFIV